MLIAHKIALDPNKAQEEYFRKGCGTKLFAWNWGLAEWQRQDKQGGRPSEPALRKHLNSLKREQFPWMYEVTKCAVQEALIDLGTAFDNFFADLKKPKTQRHCRYPRFKSKDGPTSFCAANEAGTFRVFDKTIALPVIGAVRMRETLRFTGTPKRVTISREADRWFASVVVETDDIKPAVGLRDTIGIDLGVNTLAAIACLETSGSEAVEGPKALKKSLNKLRRANKSLAASTRNPATGLRRNGSFRKYMLVSPTSARMPRTSWPRRQPRHTALSASRI